ncbi:DNA polymerase III, subunit gamma and tau [Candidatus Saccharibacteria bacterium SW_7_54_9]|nr:MAG: DNA polymerase III, subunit gamma and tau [Candidatus Saccharibacteria bacterium SW_7_54_9]
MDRLALYRKYRSQDFDQLIGQEHVATTLENALTKGRVSHAYVFTGPRGTGKTSAARIFARRLNRLEDTSHEVDIIEIDAASNNGVDEIRELREKVHVAPNYLDYKVYIIDEVHMLSGAAFNALLETLEEPPAHAIFILATTEPHKLPQTITSRTQHFPFYPVSTEVLGQHLHTIAEAEDIAIDDQALRLLAELGEGSVRDSISLLDQLAGTDERITTDHVYSVVGIAQHEHIRQLMEAAIDQKPEEMLRLLDEMLDSGAATVSVLKQLQETTRHYIRQHLKDSDMRLYNARQLLSELSSIPYNVADLGVSIESALLRIGWQAGAPASKTGETDDFRQQAASTPEQVRQKSPGKRRKSSSASQKASQQPSTHHGQSTDAESKDDGQPAAPSEAVWVKALSLIKQQNTSLYGLVRNTQVDFSPEGCTMTAQFTFHHRRLREHHNFTTIKDALEHAHGGAMPLDIVLASSSQKAAGSSRANGEDDEDSIKQVFDILGGEIV